MHVIASAGRKKPQNISVFVSKLTLAANAKYEPNHEREGELLSRLASEFIDGNDVRLLKQLREWQK